VAKALEAVAYRELVLYVAAADMDTIIGPGRAEAGDELQQRIQAAADRAGLGVDVIFVALHGVHPPLAVASSFEAAVSALEKRETDRLNALGTAAAKVHEAEGKEATTVYAAQGKAFTTEMTALADATRFEAFDFADAQASHIFRLRYYLKVVEDVLKNRKLVIAPSREEGQETVIVDLEEKPERQLFQEYAKQAKPAQGENQ
jgi:regulator of protease activity HflC (stomatin/prohibitin superfamily)